MKKITILGSTGSIGTQALEVLEHLDFEVLGLSAGKNIELFEQQIKKTNPKKVSVQTPSDAKQLKSIFPHLDVFYGEQGLEELCSDTQNDVILVATSGIVGLKPTLKAIRNKINIALANKETLVMAGDIVMAEAKKYNVKILPVDSEHSAIAQCAGDKLEFVNKLIITASGGPFLNKTVKEMNNCDYKEALKHPKWNMGRKITIDSATLMNKGLEVIEAHHLFNMPYEKIQVVVHPQSIVHSAVEFKDGSIIAQMGIPSMHIPIQYAITYPKRVQGIKTNSFSLFGQNLTFEKPDFEKFPCLKLAYDAGKTGATAPTVLNAVNEVAVNMFLDGKIGFTDIYMSVKNALENHKVIKNANLDEIFEIDKEAREQTKSLLK